MSGENLPDAATLAARYPGLSPKAAFEQWRKYCADYDREVMKAHERKLPEPKQWHISQGKNEMGTLTDFYKYVIKGKDEATNQKRFKDWLRDVVRKNLTFRNPGLGLPAPTEQQIEEEVTKDFLGAKGGTIPKCLWREWAASYLNWWTAEKRRMKQVAGRARAAKAYATRKSKKKTQKPS